MIKNTKKNYNNEKYEFAIELCIIQCMHYRSNKIKVGIVPKNIR